MMTAVIVIGCLFLFLTVVASKLWIEFAKARYFELYERKHGVRIPSFFSWEIMSADRTFNPHWRMQAAALRVPQDDPTLAAAQIEVNKRRRIAVIIVAAEVLMLASLIEIAQIS
jgi:hypothetical protein